MRGCGKNTEAAEACALKKPKRETEKEISYTNIYIQSLERWYQRIYLQGSNGETDIENRLMDTGRGEERVRGMDRVTWKLALSYVK